MATKTSDRPQVRLLLDESLPRNVQQVVALSFDTDAGPAHEYVVVSRNELGITTFDYPSSLTKGEYAKTVLERFSHPEDRGTVEKVLGRIVGEALKDAR